MPVRPCDPGAGTRWFDSPGQRNVLVPGHRLHWYELDTVLGRGGFGVTYRGRDTNLGKAVAVKEYFPRSCALREDDGHVHAGFGDGDAATFSWGLKRFLDEARTLAHLRHPGLVRVHSAFVENGTAYMVMDLEDGQSIGTSARDGRIDGEPMLLGIVHRLLDGLEHVHEAGFIHRDIKPENILIRRADGSPVLIDFGSARVAVGRETRELTSVVSRSFAPFEQYDVGSGQVRQGPWTDIYGLAATLYRVVTGEDPIDAMTRGTSLLEGAGDPLELPPARDGFSTALLEAIGQGLAFHGRDRPQTVADWRATFPPAAEAPDRPAAPASPGAAPAPPRPVDENTTEVRKSLGPATPSNLAFLAVATAPFGLNHARRMLADLGAGSIRLADSGGAALQLLDDDTDPVDVILCDVDLPGTDSMELIRHMAERRVAGSLVLVGGEEVRVLRAAESLARGLRLPVLGSLRKPFKAAALLDLLRGFKPPRAESTTRPPASLTREELEDGLEAGRVEVVYQPMVAVASGLVVGVEALARWRHPQHGLIGPGAFIQVAEDAGRIDDLTCAVLRRGIADCTGWEGSALQLDLGVNLSLESLRHPDLAERVAGILDETGFVPGRLVLELGEARISSGFRDSLETLASLRERGVRLAIDDYGTGDISLEQLRRMPFTDLKVDRAFVFAGVHDADARALLESGAEIARSMGLRAVAEGVESTEHWDLVAELGFEIAQGYHVSRPLTADALERFALRR